MIAEPFDLDLNDFLKGPHQTRLPIIDFVFAVPFDEFWEENHESIIGDISLHELPIYEESENVLGICYLSCEGGIIAVDSDHQPIGCYLVNTLCLQEKWQGQGIGRELVIHRCTLDKRNPVWDADKPAYSPAGYACHKSAWFYMRDA